MAFGFKGESARWALLVFERFCVLGDFPRCALCFVRSWALCCVGFSGEVARPNADFGLFLVFRGGFRLAWFFPVRVFTRPSCFVAEYRVLGAGYIHSQAR